jgi:hypothetical protein
VFSWSPHRSCFLWLAQATIAQVILLSRVILQIHLLPTLVRGLRCRQAWLSTEAHGHHFRRRQRPSTGVRDHLCRLWVGRPEREVTGLTNLRTGLNDGRAIRAQARSHRHNFSDLGSAAILVSRRPSETVQKRYVPYLYVYATMRLQWTIWDSLQNRFGQ